MGRHTAGEQGRSTVWYELMMQHSVVSEELTGALNALRTAKGFRFRMGKQQR